MTFFRPKRLLIVYFGCMTLAIVYMISSWDFWCKDVSESVTEWMGKYDRLQLILREKKRHLEEVEDRLEQMQREVHQRYPQDMPDILGIVNTQLPIIYVITPTYKRDVQKAELTRLSQTFRHVRRFHWVVIEDAIEKSPLVGRLLSESGLHYTHLYEPTPRELKLKATDPNWYKPRGVAQRNAGLAWLRSNTDVDPVRAVVYFADDDNTYDLKLFDEMRFTSRVSVWPVGLVGKLRYETPLLTRGRVTSWFTFWHPERPFGLDMAGFAVNASLIIQKPKAEFYQYSPRGYIESDFLVKLGVSLRDLEPKASNCTKVLVWHTRTETPDMKNEIRLTAQGQVASDPNIEV